MGKALKLHGELWGERARDGEMTADDDIGHEIVIASKLTPTVQTGTNGRGVVKRLKGQFRG